MRAALQPHYEEAVSVHLDKLNYGSLGYVIAPPICNLGGLYSLQSHAGVVTIGQGFVQNWGGLLACRFLIGVFEAGFLPGT